MGIGKVVSKSKVKPSDKETYWVEVGGSGVSEVSLRKSNAVALEPLSRTMQRKGYKSFNTATENRRERHKMRSARVNPKTGEVLDSGIQIYRLWFRFLKLALELEELGVTKLVTRQTRDRRDIPSGGNRSNNKNLGTKIQLKDTVPFKIQKNKYKDWDLDEVLNNTFNTWWKTHSYLFEGHAPSLLKTAEKPIPDFLYIRIDKTSKLEDVRDFITTEIKPILTGTPRYAINGYPRPDVIQNRYNALVLSLKGWGNQEICTGGAKGTIYLRATDYRSNDDRLSVGKTSKGKILWSALVSKQRNGGLHHLQDVMKGKFGDVPTDGVK